MFPVYFFNSYL